MIIESTPFPIGLGFGFGTALGSGLGLRGPDLGPGLDNIFTKWSSFMINLYPEWRTPTMDWMLSVDITHQKENLKIEKSI